ncbi:MAG TPA: hypothetical protein VE077_17670 [Candidatus Methylomirabilis sp.]|nr:hypothetical protein [Candidatus Methylomirabilis sp.]
MLPSEVNNIRVRDGVDFDKAGATMRYQEYIFFVNDHGPFTERFYAGEQDTPAIERRINLRVQQLRELGVINGE